MPHVLVFDLPADLMKAASPTDPLNSMITLPIPVEAQQTVAIYVEEGKDIPQQHRSAVKWQIPDGVSLRDVVGEGVVIGQGDYPAVAAAKKGFVIATARKLKVSPLYEVHYDLNKRTGGVETSASVLVTGSVSQGITITSGGDVEVRGLIEESSVTAAGSIVAKGGFAGGETGKLSAGKDLYCQFVQQGTLEARGNIVVDGSVMNAMILCGKRLVVRGSGFLVGGKILVREGVEVNRVGSEAAVVTEIEVGNNPFQALHIEVMREQVKELEKEEGVMAGAIRHFGNELGGSVLFNENDPMGSLFDAADLMRRQGDTMDDDRKESLHKFGAGIMTLMRAHHRLEQDRQDLAAATEGGGFYEGAKLKVSKIAHPGTVVKIGDAVMRLDREYERAAFMYKKPSGDARTGEVAVTFI